MNFKNVQKMATQLKGATMKNSPTIFTGLAVAGLVSTAIMAVSATPKALLIMDEERERRAENEEDDTLEYKDIIGLTWKCYVPTILMGGVTVGLMIGANSINLRRNAALASVYSLSESALKEYQAKVVETIGTTKAQKIKDEIAADKIHRNPVQDSEIIITGCGSTLCYDAWAGRYFRSDIEKIKKVFNELGRTMLGDSFISLNDMYYELNLSSTKLGDLIGWHIDDGLIEPLFSSQLTENGDPCLVLDYNIEPRYGVYE